MNNSWNDGYAKRPLNEICSQQIEIQIVGERCIYINNRRVQGGKPYVSENLPTKTKHTAMREILDAFSTEEIHAYLEEKIAVNAYCAGLRNYRDAEESIITKQEATTS